eukprot:2203439-Rhodomonas_salina.1
MQLRRPGRVGGPRLSSSHGSTVARFRISRESRYQDPQYQEGLGRTPQYSVSKFLHGHVRVAGKTPPKCPGSLAVLWVTWHEPGYPGTPGIVDQAAASLDYRD